NHNNQNIPTRRSSDLKKIKKIKETIKRLKEWANQANPPNDGLHRRAKSMEKALARIEVKKRPVIDQKKIGLDYHIDKRRGNDVVDRKSTRLNSSHVSY